MVRPCDTCRTAMVAASEEPALLDAQLVAACLDGVPLGFLGSGLGYDCALVCGVTGHVGEVFTQGAQLGELFGLDDRVAVGFAHGVLQKVWPCRDELFSCTAGVVDKV